MKVIKLYYSRTGKGRGAERVGFEVEIGDEDNVQEAVRRAKLTAQIALGEVTVTQAVRMRTAADLMNQEAASLNAAADDIEKGGF
jgi:Arc/MetJ family transcription regulator